jgi:hypothetical protein
VALASEADAAEHRYNCEGGYKRQKNWHLNDMSKGTLAGGWKQPTGEPPQVQGRWPANFILSHSEGCVLKEDVADSVCVEGCPVKQLDKQTGILVSGKDVNPTSSNVSGFFGKKDNYYSAASNYGDSGGASRFFKQFQDEE